MDESPRELVDGYYNNDVEVLPRLTPDEVAEFIRTADERFESVDPATGDAAICYRKGDKVLVYDVVKGGA